MMGAHFKMQVYKHIFTLNKITQKKSSKQTYSTPSHTIILFVCGMTNRTVDLTFGCKMVLGQASPNKFF